MRPTLRHWAVLFSVIGLVLAADQLTKLYIESALAPGQTVVPIPALGDYFRIVRSHNTGAAFGFLPDAGWLFSIIAVAVSIGMLIAHRRMPAGDWGKRLAMGLVIGGALGNVIDRIRIDHVIDFINYRIPGVISNVSNIADHGIVGGVILLLILSWRSADDSPARATINTDHTPESE
jgi:signal peptidase II